MKNIQDKNMARFVSTFFLIGFHLVSAMAQQNEQEGIISPNGPVNPFNYEIVKNKTYAKASVVSAHPLASQTGAEIMKRGGNAFDAAIATQLVLAVVYPNAGNIGGGGFLLARTSDGQLIGLDYRECAPGKAFRDMYLDANGNAQLQLSQNGHLAAGVPGTIAGLFKTYEHAKLPFKELIQPAIELAEHGFVITKKEAAGLNNYQDSFKKYNSAFPVFVKSTKWKEGDTLIQKDLAATLKRIRDKGQAGFYEGKTAKLIVAEMKKGGGIISKSDLKNYQAKTRTPLSFFYKGNEVIGFPPPSSGGILLLQMMKMIEDRNLSLKGFQTKESVQLMIEAERRAYADRAEHLGDPDFWKVPLKSLSDGVYLKNRMNDYDSTKASKSSDIKGGIIKESEQTTHLSVMDQWGNMVSVTTTLNTAYGSKTVVSGAGFLLNNEMDDFSIKAGVPNVFGAIGGDANAIVPGKRMLSSMCPVLVLKEQKPYIVIGTPGGTTIPTSIFQALVNIFEFGMSPDDAINKPKFHHQWMPDEVFIEKKFPKNVKEELEKMGYRFTERIPIGRTEAIMIGPDHALSAAADNRGDDSAAGY